MQLTLELVTKNLDGSPGDLVVLDIETLTDDASETKVIVNTSPEHRDIRIKAGNEVCKIRLDQDYDGIKDILNNDRSLR